MKDVSKSRWSRSFGRRLQVLAFGVLGVVLVFGVPSALASHQFTDVPNASPFHGDISAVKEAGVTAGKTCVPPGTPPTYCPTEAVTREAMAAFLHRGGGRLASEQVDFVTSVPAGADNFVSDADLTVGGVTGTQLVWLDATFTAFGTVAAPCNLAADLWNGALGGTRLITEYNRFPVAGYNQMTIHISGAVLATSGNHSYALSLTNVCATDISITSGHFVAATFPFGGDGTAAVIGSVPAQNPDPDGKP
jgi:hypothetical protein